MGPMALGNRLSTERVLTAGFPGSQRSTNDSQAQDIEQIFLDTISLDFAAPATFMQVRQVSKDLAEVNWHEILLVVHNGIWGLIDRDCEDHLRHDAVPSNKGWSRSLGLV